jgi:hypothetical protein
MARMRTAVVTVVGADLVELDERTDVRQVVGECSPEDCEELTRQLAAGAAKVLPGALAGWGRAVTIQDKDGNYYHADVSE